MVHGSVGPDLPFRPRGSEPKKQVDSQLERNYLEFLHVGDVCHDGPLLFFQVKKKGVLSMAKNTWVTRW